MTTQPTLAEAIRGARVIALVGAGGKTSLAWRILQTRLSGGQRSLFSTTTHVLRPADGAFDLGVVEPQAGSALTRLMGGAWRSAWAAAGIAGPFTGDRTGEMPTLPMKLRGYAPEALPAFLALDAALIVEADGALRRWLKAPAEHEPAIPGCADIVVCVACLDALGRPLGEPIAHRPERIAALTGARIGDPITPDMLARLLTSPDGGRKGIPAGARAIAALSRMRAARNPGLEAALLRGGFSAVIDLDLTGRD